MISNSEMTPIYDMNFVASLQLARRKPTDACVCVAFARVEGRSVQPSNSGSLTWLDSERVSSCREEYWEALLVLSNFFAVALRMYLAAIPGIVSSFRVNFEQTKGNILCLRR